MMNKEELKSALSFLYRQGEAIGMELYLILKTATGLELRLADFGDGQLPIDIKTGFLKYIKGRTIDNDEAEVKPLSDFDTSNTTIHNYDLEGLPIGLEIINSNLSDDQNIDTFNFNQDSLKDVKAFLVKLSSTSESIVLYKNHSHLNLLHQKNGMFFGKHNDKFEKLQDDILRFSFTIDFLKIGNEIFVYDTNCLQREFNFDSILINNAQTRITELGQLNFVDNIGELTTFANNKKGAKKVLNLNRQSPVLSMQFSEIKTFIEGNEFLRRRFRFNSEGTMLHLDTAKSKEYFINLMNDNYLTSELTSIHYNSPVKRNMTEDDELANSDTNNGERAVVAASSN